MLENTGQKTNKKTHYKNKHNQEKANNAKYSRPKLPYILAYKSPPKNRFRMWSKITDPHISRRWLLRTYTGCKLR